MRTSVALSAALALASLTLLPSVGRAYEGAVELHIDAPRPVRLERSVPFGYELVCTSPCDITLPPFPETVNAGLVVAGATLLLGPGTPKTEIWWKKGPAAPAPQATSAAVLVRAPTWADPIGARPRPAMNLPLLRLRF